MVLQMTSDKEKPAFLINSVLACWSQELLCIGHILKGGTDLIGILFCHITTWVIHVTTWVIQLGVCIRYAEVTFTH